MSFCILYLLLGTGFLAGGAKGGSHSPCYWFSSGGLPDWGHLDNLGLGLGCSGPFRSPVGFNLALVFW